MRLLLDTHTLLWTLVEPTRLSAQATAAIAAAESEVFVSIVSPWEMAIAKARGRMNPPDDLATRVTQSRFELMPIQLRHIQTRGLHDLGRVNPSSQAALTIRSREVDFPKAESRRHQRQ